MAYAAVISLQHTIDRLKNRYSSDLSEYENKRVQFLFDYRPVNSDRILIHELGEEMSDAAFKLSTAEECDQESFKQESISYFFTTVSGLADQEYKRVLLNNAEDVGLHIRLTTSEDQYLEFLRSTLKGLDDRRHININRSLINGLEAQIREAAYKLEDAIEFYALNHSSGSLDCDLESLKQEKTSFFTTVKELAEEYIRVLNNPLPPDEEDDEDIGGNETAAVGLSDLVEIITKELLEWQHGRRSVSIVGMAGIGKTRLAQEIYHHPIIKHHFKFTAWVKIGQHPDAERVLRDVVAQVERQVRNNEHMEKVIEFKSIVQDERYLIVLDDVWSTNINTYLVRQLPGRRQFLVTTRREEVAQYHSTSIFRMPFLDKEQSWSLLRQIVFADDESISSSLEEGGRIIADICEGLPLLILTVAHILRGKERTEVYWKKVGEGKTSTFPDAFEQIYEVLILSYDYLPQYLKACFLYMGVFPQGFVIPTTKLRRLSTVEDFMDRDECWNYEMELVSNNIVIVCKRSSANEMNIKSSKLHSAYWYLCVKEARKVNFFHALNKLTDVYTESRPRRMSFQNNVLLGLKEVYDSMAANTPSTTRSLLCMGKYHQYPVRICFNMILLKVLDALAVRFYEFPSEILNLVQLKYLALTHDGIVPSSISNLQEMQCLILRQHHNIRFLRHSTYMPEEIWDMKKLRHLQIMGCNLPDPPYIKRMRQPNLETLYVNAESCTEKVFNCICGFLTKLRITIELEPDAANTLSLFEHIGKLFNLKSLKCVVLNPRVMTRVVAPPDHLSRLSDSLRKLSLNGLGYSWKNIRVIGLLPKLEVLKLRCNAFQGPEWESRWDEFRLLKILVLEDIDLVHWTLDYGSRDTFFWLGRLFLRHCYKMKEIPIINRLKRLDVVDCSPSLVASAEQQRSSSLEVDITSSWNYY